MAILRRFAQLGLGTLLISSVGCGAAEPKERNVGVARQKVDSGDAFEVTGNPIISYDRTHYSSDPSVIVIPGFTQGEGSPQDLLVMVTSTDLVDLNPVPFPMDGTHLYSTFADDNLNTTWFEYGSDRIPGPVIQESDFDNWVLEGSNQMFAPDIEFVPGSDGPGTFFLYVPDDNQGKKKRIGVATALSPGGSTLYDEFIPKNADPNDFFKILPGERTLPNLGLPPSEGFAMDPGVFHAEQDVVPVPPAAQPTLHDGRFMAYVDTAPGGPAHNLSLLRLTDDMLAGTYLGKISFSTYASYSGLNVFMEGPDIHALSTPSPTDETARKNYYLVFVSQVEMGDFDTSYIGYAMCTPTEFWNNPTGCWRFKGWLFRNQHTGRNNQVSLAQIQGRTYVFFHRVEPVNNTSVGRGISRARQVCVKEIELVNNPGGTDDGEIRGVKPAANQNIANDFITLDGLTRGITKGFIHFRDETRTNTTQASVRLTGLNPASIAGLPARAPFRLFYFLDIEPGTNLNPVLTAQSDAFLQLATPPLRHISQRTWAVVLNYTPPATGALSTNIGGLLTLRYDMQGLTQPAFVKTNDFSQPLDTYHTWTSRIALENMAGTLLAGERPEIIVPVHVRTAVPDADGLTTFLTVSGNELDFGINNQYLKTGSLADQQTQQWIKEDASQFPYVADDDKPSAFRLRSVSAGFYMTGNDVTRIDAQRPEFFFLLSQALRPNWDTQVWVTQPVDATPNLFRIMSAWKPYDSEPDFNDLMFLTRDNTRTNNRGLQDVYVQPEVTTNDRQKWLIDPIPVSVYFRTAVADADQRFTYLALTSTAVHAGINAQYLNTGTPGQEWVFEPPTGFTLPAGEDPTRAFRVRNVQTNLYMTSNDDPARNPHFQLLDQPLNVSWNTQIWIKEDTGSGTFRMRTLFNPDGQPLFLTRNITNPNNNRGAQGVFVQPTDAANAPRQIWFIE